MKTRLLQTLTDTGPFTEHLPYTASVAVHADCEQVPTSSHSAEDNTPARQMK
jgi:hypothetical protein